MTFPILLSLSLATAYVLQVKVEMELELQQYEKAKAVREEQLERLTQICQEQAVNNTQHSSVLPLLFPLTFYTSATHTYIFPCQTCLIQVIR